MVASIKADFLLDMVPPIRKWARAAALTRSAERPKCGADILGEQLLLFPCGEVTAFLNLVER
jgi:hypothetical protein